MGAGFPSAAGRGSRRFGGRSPVAEINVTPLVDVMLVLLIIFMVTAPLLKAGVPVNLPESKAKALGEEREQLTLSISRAGTVYLDDLEVPSGMLPERLAEIPKVGAGDPPQVILRADRAIAYGRIMEVMGELNQSGFHSISLITVAAGQSDVGDRDTPRP